jgi:hypothetical protein
MAGMAEYQRLPLAGSHDLNPLRLLSTGVFFQVFECPDMMHLDASRSRFSSSDLFHWYCLIWSSMGALIFQTSEIPPQVATSGFFPSRATVTCNPL